MSVSIVIPTYKGENTIGPLVHELLQVFRHEDLQVVIVNDSSPDGSDAVCRRLVEQGQGRVTYVLLNRNFGEHNAVMAGLRCVRGDWVVVMDDDFQNPPAEALRLLREAREHDHDIVYAYYPRKEHAWWRNLGSEFLNWVADFMLDKPKGLYLSSFKCMSRFLAGEVVKYSGPYPYIDGLALRSTRRIGRIQCAHEAREEGESSYTIRKLVRLWLNMFFNFSIMPLRLSMLMGFCMSLLGFALMVVVIVEKLVHPDVALGYPSIMTSIVFFAGVQLIILGVLGEYLGRLFLSANKTPQCVVREVYEATKPTAVQE